MSPNSLWPLVFLVLGCSTQSEPATDAEPAADTALPDAAPVDAGPTLFAVSDDFQRAALGGNWAPAGGGENLVILNNSIAGNDGNSSFGCRGSQWTANDADWRVNTYAQVTLPANYTQGTLLHVGVRVGGDGANQNYGCGYYGNVGPCASGWILKRDGGPGGTNQLGNCPDKTRTCYFACGGPEIPAPVGGEVIRVESRWNPSTATNDLKCIVTTSGGSYQYQGSDPVLTLPGRPRIVTCEGTPGATSRVFESWESGNL